MELPKLEGVTAYQVVSPVTVLSPQERAQQRQLIQAVRSMNEAEFFGQSSELTFTLDPGTHKPILKLVDKRTQEVIRQIPPEYLLRLAEDAKRR